MTDRLPLLGAAIAISCLALFVWAASSGSIEWPPGRVSVRTICDGMEIESAPVAGRYYVLDGTPRPERPYDPGDLHYYTTNGTHEWVPRFVANGAGVPDGFHFEPGITDKEWLLLIVRPSACATVTVRATINASMFKNGSELNVAPVEMPTDAGSFFIEADLSGFQNGAVLAFGEP